MTRDGVLVDIESELGEDRSLRPAPCWNAMMTRFSPCLEWLFAENGNSFPERIWAAEAAGFSEIEFWGTTDKQLDEVEVAIYESGVKVVAFVSEPRGHLVDPSTHREFLSGIARSSRIAERLGARNLIVVTGDRLPGIDRANQMSAICTALTLAAPIAAATGLGLLLEPLNTRLDHPGYFLDSTLEGLQVVRLVAQPNVLLLYDIYHSVTMGEDPGDVLKHASGLVGHVHIADVPGRHEPGSGVIDWPRQLAVLASIGYSGPIGLEYRPTTDTESSLRYLRGFAKT